MRLSSTSGCPTIPEAARALLAEAGYPNGFSVTLDCPNNYYINDEAICRAVAEQLSEIGIAVSVNAQPEDRHYQKVGARESDFWLESFTAETLNSLEVFLISHPERRRLTIGPAMPIRGSTS